MDICDKCTAELERIDDALNDCHAEDKRIHVFYQEDAVKNYENASDALANITTACRDLSNNRHVIALRKL